ncbi:MAG: leucine-rich repeat domain-containing protein [Chlamydiales bacterium]
MAHDIAVQSSSFTDPIAFLATPLGPEDTIGKLVMSYLMDASLSAHPELGVWNRQAMVFEARSFLYNHPEDRASHHAESARFVPHDVNLEDATNQLFQELTPLIQSIDCYILPRIWRGLEREKNLALEERDEDVRRQRLGHLGIYLDACKKPLAAMQKNPEKARAWEMLNHNLRTVLAVCRTCARFRDVIARQDLDPSNPHEIAACFDALHQSQKRAVESLGAEAVGLLDAEIQKEGQHSFHFWRFGEVERIVSASLSAMQGLDKQLALLWRRVKALHPNIGPPLVRMNGDYNTVRDWINNPVPADALRPVVDLTLRNLAALAPEIGRFSRLQHLMIIAGNEVNQKLTGLPEEMRALQALRSLNFMAWRGQPHHALAEIPPVVGELRALEYLDVSGPIEVIPEFLAELPHLSGLWIGGSRIRAIPDRIWRHVYLQHTSFRREFWKFLGGERRTEDEIRAMTFGIDPAQLTDIPFSLWLERFRISFIPIYTGFERLISPLRGCIISDNRHVIFQVLFWIPFIPFILFVALPVSFSVMVLQALVNLPLFLYNLTLTYIVEPLATAIREELGYGPMKHIRDEESVNGL